MESDSMLTLSEKSPQPEGAEEGWTHTGKRAQHNCWLSYSGPDKVLWNRGAWKHFLPTQSKFLFLQKENGWDSTENNKISDNPLCLIVLKGGQ